jgi:hypothetical protein
MLLAWIRRDLITGHVRLTGHCINKYYTSSPDPFSQVRRGVRNR